MRRSFKLITLFNIPIEINISWFIILGLVIFTLAQGYFPFTNPGLYPLAHWLMAVIAALFLFASLLAHELSHSLVARKYNLPIHGITLFVFGGVAHLEKEPATPAIEFKMAIAGPLMSFCLSLIFFALTQLFYNLGFPLSVLSITNYLFMLNLIIGLFNLIPGFPLDGGRILRSLIWHFTQDIRKATAIASTLGKSFALVLIAFGLLNLFQGSIISGVWLIFIGLFLQEAAESSYRQVAMKKLLSGTTVQALMTRAVITVPAGITLDKLVDNFFFKFRHATFPIMAEDGILGLVTLHDIKSVPKEQWPTTTAQDVMIPVIKDLTIDSQADVMEALAQAARNGLGRLLVIEDKKLVGILTQRDILRLFQFKAEIEA